EAGRTQHFLLSRFETSPDNPYQALPESETVILAQADRTDSHNGGDLRFGADGYLYISTGEHGPGLSPARNLSRIDAGLFGILRIDVDLRPGNLKPNPHPAATAHYAIPADNPFIGRTEYLGETVDPTQICTELYAVGFRNPWRLCLDVETGDLYAGDVGSQAYEEINLVVRGANYGWPYREGALPEPAGFEPVAPLWSGSRGWETNQAECIIGGMVYRGSQIPSLQGAYLFGGFRSGHVMALRHQGNRATDVRRLTGIRSGLSCFAADPRDREVMLAHLFEGTIYRLAYRPPESSPVPQRLSQLGAFSSLATLVPADGVIPYQINAPFWSDNALKRRFFILPSDGQPVQVDGNTGPWSFPVGMIWVKHFDLE
ncbi:MAG: PQQ-dependent sugar dehydrogenase, partial [Verrucomicrobiales bacterium]